MCQPAWRGSTRHRIQWEQMKHPHQNYRPRKTQNQPSEKNGNPNAIRAEQGEQEVAAVTYHPESNFPLPSSTAGQFGPPAPISSSKLETRLRIRNPIRMAAETAHNLNHCSDSIHITDHIFVFPHFSSG
ncbi:MAG TPA: hypothetical protein DCM07_28835 [Planctomycetaceae bacterium]|uniref:hypothetical protein n=1 Tax=Gimesia sp. TaxID=2024833 RepID=UPI000C634F1D|nr:hypothetical protein [Gimesia sp.]MAX37231.1 hypothetical protein [Gimesia sp.]HAH48774.1 hypothetical protein [Planctomycetaceae bacterium]HBL46120.1 hypothetical protein [Planctomycetaceae bacterium]